MYINVYMHIYIYTSVGAQRHVVLLEQAQHHVVLRVPHWHHLRIPPGIFGTKATMVASLFIPTSPGILDGKQTLIVSVHQAFLNLFARFGWLNHLDILVFTPYFMPVSERINCSFCLSYLTNTYYLMNSMLMVDWARLLSQQC